MELIKACYKFSVGAGSEAVRLKKIASFCPLGVFGYRDK